jgi:DNA-binding transcriptional regulator YiaG
MKGRKDQKKANKTRSTVSEELDENALLGDLRRFVEESEPSIPKIASLMGVFTATLSIWIAGAAKPSKKELLMIKSFLERRDSDWKNQTPQQDLASKSKFMAM